MQAAGGVGMRTMVLGHTLSQTGDAHVNIAEPPEDAYAPETRIGRCAAAENGNGSRNGNRSSGETECHLPPSRWRVLCLEYASTVL